LTLYFVKCFFEKNAFSALWIKKRKNCFPQDFSTGLWKNGSIHLFMHEKP